MWCSFYKEHVPRVLFTSTAHPYPNLIIIIIISITKTLLPW